MNPSWQVWRKERKSFGGWLKVGEPLDAKAKCMMLVGDMELQVSDREWEYQILLVGQFPEDQHYGHRMMSTRW